MVNNHECYNTKIMILKIKSINFSCKRKIRKNKKDAKQAAKNNLKVTINFQNFIKKVNFFIITVRSLQEISFSGNF